MENKTILRTYFARIYVVEKSMEQKQNITNEIELLVKIEKL